MPSPTNAKDVVSRLTDTKTYTGTHAHRFDEEGKGKGIVGRATVVEFKGNTNTREVESSSPVNKARKPVVAAPLGKQKFGTQADKAISVYLYRNGDKHHKGEKVSVHPKTVKTWEQMLEKATNSVRLPTGAVRKIYKSDMRTPVKALTDFEDGAKYLCCGGEKPAELEKSPADLVNES